MARPKATDPVVQRNYYLPKSELEAFENKARQDGRKPAEIVADLVKKWTSGDA